MPTKLTIDNYLVWQAQILPLLHGYKLMPYIENPPPSLTIVQADGQMVNDIYGLLLGHEAFLRSQAMADSPAAFHIKRGGSYGKGSGSTNSGHSFFSQSSFPHNPGQANTNSSKPKTICQICNRTGHPAKLCPDPDWKPNPRTRAYNTKLANSQPFTTPS